MQWSKWTLHTTWALTPALCVPAAGLFRSFEMSQKQPKQNQHEKNGMTMLFCLHSSHSLMHIIRTVHCSSDDGRRMTNKVTAIQRLLRRVLLIWSHFLHNIYIIDPSVDSFLCWFGLSDVRQRSETNHCFFKPQNNSRYSRYFRTYTDTGVCVVPVLSTSLSSTS